MTTLGAIVAAIVAALSADLGTFDLSATGQVREGTYTAPPGDSAFACVLPARMVAAKGQARNTWYLETHEVRVRVWGPVVIDGTDNRVARGRLLQEEAKVALDNARSNQATALWRCVTFACTAVEPVAAGATAAAGWAFAELVLTFSFRRASGTGV